MRGRPRTGWSQWLLLLAFGLIVGLFSGIITQSTSVLAADAIWSSNSTLEYNNSSFSEASANEAGDIRKSLSLLDNQPILVSKKNTPGQSASEDVQIIAFPALIDRKDATNAQFFRLRLTESEYKKISGPQNIKIKKQGEGETAENNNPNSTNTDTPESENVTECAIDGIGWLICPMSNWVASGMDMIFELIAWFMEVPPIDSSSRGTGLYMTWEIMRNFANVVFVVMFLVIIYSQITSFGISNYGVKRMLPRLAITALLVNISFLACAVAVDLSNALGHSLQDILMDIRETVQENGTGADLTWSKVTTFILSNGTIGAGAVGWVIAQGGMAAAVQNLTIALAPILLTVVLIAAVVLLVLAVRQALIVILIVISPLAVVAYMLPGTEKWFDKWKDLFFTMLVFFPAFSVVYGGAQLASAIILKTNTSPIIGLVGLAVQVAPLAIIPLLMKLGGGLLGRITGMVNDPSKGLIDKTKNWANDMQQANRNKAYAKEPGKAAIFKRAGRSFRTMNQARKERIERYQKEADNAYNRSLAHQRLAMDGKRAEETATAIKAAENSMYEEAEAGHAVEVLNGPHTAFERVRAGLSSSYRDRLNSRGAKFAAEAKDIADNIAIEGLRTSNAQRLRNKELAKEMIANEGWQVRAGGIAGVEGQGAAIASAVSAKQAEEAKSVEEATKVLQYHGLPAEDKQALALGRSITTPAGVKIDPKEHSFIREAAIEMMLKQGTVDEVVEIVSAIEVNDTGYMRTVASTLGEAAARGKAPFLDGKLINQIVSGKVKSKADIVDHIAGWVKDGKFNAQQLATTDAMGMKLLRSAIDAHSIGIGADALENLRDKLNVAIENDNISTTINPAAATEIRNIIKILP